MENITLFVFKNFYFSLLRRTGYCHFLPVYIIHHLKCILEFLKLFLFQQSTLSCYLALHKAHEYFKILLTYVMSMKEIISNLGTKAYLFKMRSIIKSEPFNVWNRRKMILFNILIFQMGTGSMGKKRYLTCPSSQNSLWQTQK